MRLAILVASAYRKSSQLPSLPSAVIDAELMTERLSEPDARAVTVQLEPGADLVAEVEQMLSRHPPEPEVVFYFSGHVSIRDDGGLALLGSSRRGGSAELSGVCGLLARRASAGLVILDAVHGPDPEDPMASVSVVAAAREAVDPAASGVSLLVGARPFDRAVPDGPSLFTRLLLLALERSAPGATPARAVYDAMRADEERFMEIPAAGYFAGRSEVALLVAASTSSAPTTLRSERASAPPPSAPPVVADLVASGDAHARAGRHDDAIADFKRALLVLGSRRGAGHAALYAKIGDAKRALGKDAEAVHNYDKALSSEPANERAFEAARALLERAGDWDGLERLYQRKLQTLEAPGRAAIWKELALHWLDDAKDVSRGIVALEHWLSQRPSDVDALERLVFAQSELGRHAAANAARRRLADAVKEPAKRAAVLAEAARIAAEHLPQKDEAVALARAALDADPSALAALEVAATLLARGRKWAELAEIYERIVDRTEDDQVAWDLGKRLGMLYRDELDDRAAAKRALAKAQARAPGDVDLVMERADLYEADQDFGGVGDVLRRAAPALPPGAGLYRRALGAFEKAGDADAAWCAASVLDLIGEADINESLLADAHRPEGLIAAQGTLDDAAWTAGLFWPDRDVELSAVLDAVSRAAVAARIDELDRAGKLPAFDPGARQDPDKSTATVSRSLVWTSRLLGVPLPALYVLPETEGELHAVPAREPTVMAGMTLASGLGLAELAFLWGRHLCFFRPEHYLLVFYPSLRDLGSLLLAALSLGGAEQEAVSLEGNAAKLAAGLGDALDAGARGALERAVAAFQPRNTRRRIVAWARSVHLAAARAGLLACGDLHRTAQLVRRFPPGGEVTPEEQIADLCAWSIGAGYGELRRRLGVALP